MERPVCKACNQRFCAVNYHKDGIAHYRSKCEYCLRKGRRIKTPEPRWKVAGYKKKTTCDRCGFRSKYAAQLLVYHIDGNMNNNNLRNLKTICQNCVIDVTKSDLPWRAGDLEEDR